MSNSPIIHGGQGRSQVDLLALWPGLFRIGLVGLVIGCAVLVAHVVTKANQSVEALAQARAHSINQSTTSTNN